MSGEPTVPTTERAYTPWQRGLNASGHEKGRRVESRQEKAKGWARFNLCCPRRMLG
jgi:hypothetical protein